MVPPDADSPRSRTFDSLEQEVYLNLWRTYDRLRAAEDELFAQHQLTAQQYNALRILAVVHPGSLPMLQLAGKLISRAPDITRLIDKLEARRLVLRERQAENRRVVQVRITPEGLALLAELAQPVLDCATRQVGHLTSDEQRQLIALLRTARRPHEGQGSGW